MEQCYLIIQDNGLLSPGTPWIVCDSILEKSTCIRCVLNEGCTCSGLYTNSGGFVAQILSGFDGIDYDPNLLSYAACKPRLIQSLRFIDFPKPRIDL